METPDSNSVGLPYKQTVEEHRNTEKDSSTCGAKDRMESRLSDRGRNSREAWGKEGNRSWACPCASRSVP